MPRQWIGSPLPITLPADGKASFIDQNGHLVPSSPLLPLFLAVDAMPSSNANPSTSVDWPSVDFVTDRNNLRKLLAWVKGSSYDKKKWRMDIQLGGTQTVLLGRWEERTARTAEENNFGHSFELGMTTRQPRDSEGYHRIIHYVRIPFVPLDFFLI